MLYLMEMYDVISKLSFNEVAGLAAAFISLSATLLYVTSIGKSAKSTRPERATWLIWLLASTLLTFSYYQSGAVETLFLPVALTLEYLLVFILSIKYGIGGWNKSDVFCIIGAIIGLGVWWNFNSPELGLYIFILVDAFGAYPTLIKSWRHPRSEALLPWLITLLASAVNLLAVDWSGVQLSLVACQESAFAVASYPVYLFAVNGLIVFGLIHKKLRKKPVRSS